MEDTYFSSITVEQNCSTDVDEFSNSAVNVNQAGSTRKLKFVANSVWNTTRISRIAQILFYPQQSAVQHCSSPEQARYVTASWVELVKLKAR